MDPFPGINTVSASGLASIRTIATLHETLSEALNTSDCVEIDMAAGDPVDLSFLQLVEAARLSARNAKKEIRLSPAAREAVLETLKRAGFLDDIADEDARFWLHEGKRQ